VEKIEKLKFENLHIGMEVFDEKDKGKIIECNDIHNVYVKFETKHGEGFGLYCLDLDCDQYSPLYEMARSSNG